MTASKARSLTWASVVEFAKYLVLIFLIKLYLNKNKDFLDKFCCYTSQLGLCSFWWRKTYIMLSSLMKINTIITDNFKILLKYLNFFFNSTEYKWANNRSKALLFRHVVLDMRSYCFLAQLRFVDLCSILFHRVVIVFIIITPYIIIFGHCFTFHIPLTTVKKQLKPSREASCLLALLWLSLITTNLKGNGNLLYFLFSICNLDKLDLPFLR